MPQPVSSTSRNTKRPAGGFSCNRLRPELARPRGQRHHPWLLPEGLGGVGEQVHHDLLQLGRIGQRARHGAIELQVQHRGLGQRGAQDLDVLLHQRAQVHGAHLEAAPARVGQHLPGQVRRAPGGAHRLLDAAAGERLRRQVLLRQVEVRQDGQQQVVEVVRDAARQHPQALQLLAVQQPALHLQPLVLGQLALGDVLDRPDHGGDLARVVELQSPVAVDPARLAVGPADDTVHPLEGLPPCEHLALEVVHHPLAIVRVQQADPGWDVVHVVGGDAEDPVEQRRAGPATAGDIQ
jgi:hypothetical protein